MSQSEETNRLKRIVSDSFYSFLEDNYNGDTITLYQNFLADVSSMLTNKENLFDVKINKNVIKEVNNTLFVRDNEHYYYFYPEVLLVKEKNSQVLESFIENSTIPFLLIIDHSIVSSKYKGYYESNILAINKKGGLWEELRANYTNPFVAYLIKQQEQIGELSILNVAKFFCMESHKTLLEDSMNRQLIDILFWKFLCIRVSINFHKPLSLQPWESDLNIILSK